MARCWLPSAVALATVLTIARAPRADAARVVERVVAVVDGRPILASELVRRAAPEERALSATNLPSWRRGPLRRRLLYDVLERMVEERLIAAEARARGLSVTPAELEAAIAQIASSQGLSRAEIDQAIVAHGWTLADYQRELSSQLLERRLLGQWVAAQHRTPKTPEHWAKERKRWLAELRRRSFIELRLPR